MFERRCPPRGSSSSFQANSYPSKRAVKSQSTLISRIVRGAIWVLVVAITSYELLLIALYSRPDAVDRCLHVGLPSGLPEGTVAESVIPDARLAWWPLGLECSFSAGGKTLVVSPDWSATVVGAIGICLIVVGVWLASRSTAHKQRQ